MASFALTSDVPQQPRQSIAGIVSLYIAQITGSTVLLNGASIGVSNNTGSISSITFPTGSGQKFWKYDFPPDTCKWEQDGKASQPNASVFVEQKINFEIPLYQSSTRDQIQRLASQDVLVISKMTDGNFWLFGATRGMTLDSFKSDSGTKLGDFQGWKNELKGSEPFEAFFVTGSMIPALTIPA